jgi:hypothetical protein
MVHNHSAIDFHIQLPTMPTVGGEDRALLGSNPSARIDDGASAGVSLAETPAPFIDALSEKR